MLIVVEDGDVQLFLKPSLDLEAHRRRDVLQVDSTESGSDRLTYRHELLNARGTHTDGVGIDVRELLEQHRLALHHRHGRLRADVAETEHGCAVGQHSNRVRLDGVVPHHLGMLRDRGTDPADTRGVPVSYTHLRAHETR